MAALIKERMCAQVEGEVVVFLIGMRINALWKVWRWGPVAAAMPRMLRELAMQPELGLLSAQPVLMGPRDIAFIQYWKSAAHLQAYAKATDHAHLPAWRAFNKAIGTSGDVGIWHETYVVPQGHMSSVYVNMPRFGLGLAGELIPARGARASEAGRLTAVARAPQTNDPV